MLGELYEPKGLALETAQAVLQVDEPYAVNLSLGCINQCAYCYVPRFTHRSANQCTLPKKDSVDLVRHQLEKFRAAGVFLSFLTDPFLPFNKDKTNRLVRFLLEKRIRVATLSKLDVSFINGARHGMTIVSLDKDFWQTYEPKTISPQERMLKLEACHNQGNYAWVSMEPYPPSAMHHQDFKAFLEKFKFVNLIIFGKLNYNSRANTEQARNDYAENTEDLTDFCKSNQIRLHVKSDTLKFVNLK